LPARVDAPTMGFVKEATMVSKSLSGQLLYTGQLVFYISAIYYLSGVAIKFIRLGREQGINISYEGLIGHWCRRGEGHIINPRGKVKPTV
jgi:hypothetical protein